MEKTNVVQPDYYVANGLQPLDVIDAFGLDFYLGNAVRYICRAGRKDPARTVEDLEKAAEYLRLKIARLRDTPPLLLSLPAPPPEIVSDIKPSPHIIAVTDPAGNDPAALVLCPKCGNKIKRGSKCRRCLTQEAWARRRAQAGGTPAASTERVSEVAGSHVQALKTSTPPDLRMKMPAMDQLSLTIREMVRALAERNASFLEALNVGVRDFTEQHRFDLLYNSAAKTFLAVKCHTSASETTRFVARVEKQSNGAWGIVRFTPLPVSAAALTGSE